MVETDWREILSFSQRELMQADKEKLCESLSWMEADDIELNFTDLKTLFRLAQDILKYKSEQVNNLMGQLETSQRKIRKKKVKTRVVDSPNKSPESVIETIAQQDEIIKANKEILERLYIDIAELESKKNKLEEDKSNLDKDSESSRDPLSEMNEVKQLENEITMKNKHIRKFLIDVKSLEEDNTQLKEKISMLKEKLTEATQLIENLTDQMLTNNNECFQIKDALGKSEKSKAQLMHELESLRKELFEKNTVKENLYEDIKAKVQHWKNVARSKKHETEVLSSENRKLKEQLENVIRKIKIENKGTMEENLDHEKIKELQEKLSEASNEILQSVNVIELLKTENRQLKSTIEETHDTVSLSDARNESDDGKQRMLINKLKRRIKVLTISLQGAEEMIAEREKEITEITSQLLLVRSDEGINALIEGIKTKKRQLKIKDEGIKSLVHEVNSLNQLVNDLQLENEVLKNRLNIAPEEKIPTQGLTHKYRQLEIDNSELSNELRKIENKLVAVELRCRQYSLKIEKLLKFLNELGYSNDIINKTSESSDDNDIMPLDSSRNKNLLRKRKIDIHNKKPKEKDFKDLVEENEGLRKGLEEILQYLKENSTTSSGLLALQCPSLEAVLHSLDSRHFAGWYAPHMSAVMEAKTAKGGRDALLNALHEARKETYDALTQLSKESQKSQELEKKLLDATKKSEQIESISYEFDFGEFGTWISETEPKDIDLYERSKVEALVNEGNAIYEKQLKTALTYFHKKFKELYEKINTLLVKTIDDQNNYFIKKEQYKAQIESFKAQLDLHEENDISEDSPGLVAMVNPIVLQRKCSYLEESYKYIRTLNENMKIEYVESKRDAMVLKNEYESKIQKLILSVANLTDKLRKSISVELFWRQNDLLNDFVTKYRDQLNSVVKSNNDSVELEKRLDNEKVQIIRHIEAAHLNGEKRNDALNQMLSTVENSVLQKQLQQTCAELIKTQQEVEKLRETISELHETENKLIDRALSSYSTEEIDLMKNQLKQLAEENQTLKEQCHHVRNQLDIALLQLQDNQQRQMSYDMETNMLRHQILDLQSTGDNKAIVARLSGEVLVAHLQASESHKKIERLNTALQDEKQARAEIEEMMQARQTIFDVYTLRYESKFRYMFEVMQVLRQQYQGALPITSLENYLNNLDNIFRKTKAVNDTLDEIEDLRSELITKHSVYNQILEVSKNKCIEDENNCSHKLKHMVLEKMHLREKEHSLKKVQTLELSREQLTKQCNDLEKTLLMVNQGFEKTNFEEIVERKNSIQKENIPHLKLEDIASDEEQSSRRSKTITLPKPQILKSPKSIDLNLSKKEKDQSLPSDNCDTEVIVKETSSVFVQTTAIESHKKCKVIQTDEDQNLCKLKQSIEKLKKELEIKAKKLSEIEITTKNRNDEFTALKKEKLNIELTMNKLKESDLSRDNIISRLNSENDELRLQINQITNEHFIDKSKTSNEEKESMLITFKQLEDEKNAIVKDYKKLLSNEREEYSKSVKDLHVKIMELQTQLDRKGSDSNTSNTEALKEVVGKYLIKIAELEDHSFKLQSQLDNCRTELVTYQNEADRWKGLAVERLTKMEQLNYQLEERHNTEVESYKAENQHWLSQLGDSQKSHLELRNRLSEQKTVHVKQMADKDSQIEQLRTIIYNLKTQIMNMQTMMSVNDPSFDLSAIVEVEESSDATSNCDKLELRFDSTTDINDLQHDEIVKIPASSTTIWQEPIIERLRREKQLALKQNAILRRQIKALAARERRSRLDAQNLKNQVFRISTSGRTPSTAENAALHSKVVSLQAQLTSARRETHTGLALWDKWKRAQQSSDRWQARYEERCQEVKKIETSLNYSKSAVSRLEREKRLLLIRLNEIKDKRCSCIEKQEEEPLEKLQTDVSCGCSDSPVSARALLDRVEAQQRRIVALETAEKGNELLVSEYEKSLAEITALKGQLLKLESTLLESQIRMPLKTKEETSPELEYWKNYCEMLKEENMQMTMKINSLEITPTTANHQRVNDLEQTVLTLRGLLSKLQAEQKSNSVVVRRVESRPNSGRSNSEKARNYQETYRTEVSNLKRSIQDKDLLLERSKEMLKIAAEREDELLRENAFLRRKLDELSRPKGGFLSA